MKLQWRCVALVGSLTLGLLYLLSESESSIILAQTAPGNGLPTTTSSGRAAIGGPGWVRPSQLPPNWEQMHPNWLEEPGGFFGGWHSRGVAFPKRPRAPVSPGSVFPSVAPGTAGPAIIK